MTLSRLEQETIITFNEAESFAEVYTHNGRLKTVSKSLQRLELTKWNTAAQIMAAYPIGCRKSGLEFRHQVSEKL